MSTAKATTNSLGNHMMSGVDFSNNASFELRWETKVEERDQKEIMVYRHTLGDLMDPSDKSGLSRYSFLAGKVFEAGASLHDQVYAGKGSGGLSLIRVGGKEYRQIGALYDVVEVTKPCTAP